VTPSHAVAADLVERVREHYLAQFRDFVAKLREDGSVGYPELKLEPKGPPSEELYRNLCCIDFVKDPAKPRLFELELDRYLGFAPLAATFGGVALQIVALRWDCVNFYHDAPSLEPECLADWFETWFDPDDKHRGSTTELSGIIHSLVISKGFVSVDFGSAPVDAFWSFLEALEKAGVKNVRVSDKQA
jgi:hypothetical protein